MTNTHSIDGLSHLNAAVSGRTGPESADYQAARELILKLPYLKSSLSPGAGTLLDNVVSVSSSAKKKGSGHIYLYFHFNLVAVK